MIATMHAVQTRFVPASLPVAHHTYVRAYPALCRQRGTEQTASLHATRMDSAAVMRIALQHLRVGSATATADTTRSWQTE